MTSIHDGNGKTSPQLSVTRKALPSAACAATAPRQHSASGVIAASSDSHQVRHAAISALYGRSGASLGGVQRNVGLLVDCSGCMPARAVDARRSSRAFQLGRDTSSRERRQ